ncbi:hypothetical protein BSK56_33315 [Paenibacillus borealis]|uniref:Uncharacterized protein n=1 Tax=Paenibacillus borealis TaxID=160799 RepID=A0ABX3GU12_PAEBO|nr:hypothetical protein [Paenibacillus borealis]OMD35018.1 hypothetical protein BSK56_33315 [Paenibacillus borealis]
MGISRGGGLSWISPGVPDKTATAAPVNRLLQRDATGSSELPQPVWGNRNSDGRRWRPAGRSQGKGRPAYSAAAITNAPDYK